METMFQIGKSAPFRKHGFFLKPAVVFAAALSACLPAFGQGEAPPGWSLGYDLIVQDVCVDRTDKPIAGVSPLDGHDKCPSHRNLRIGEKLPYHKQDWPQSGDVNHAQGYSRNDEYPTTLGALGTVVVQERTLLEQQRSGGGLFIFSDKFAASGFTQDPSGMQVFYGPNCDAPNPADRVKDAWIFMGRDVTIGGSGQTVARLTRFLRKCPNALASSFTRWHTETIKFRVGSPTGSQDVKPLVTLVSDHFGGRELATADHLERFYFTRELGLIRWERWQNATRAKGASVQVEPVRAGKCDSIEKRPESDEDWHMVKCRQWTNLVAPENSAGDAPDTRFLDTAKATLSSLGQK